MSTIDASSVALSPSSDSMSAFPANKLLESSPSSHRDDNAFSNAPADDHPAAAAASRPSLKKRWLAREDSNRSIMSVDTASTADSTSCGASVSSSSSSSSSSSTAFTLGDGDSVIHVCDQQPTSATNTGTSSGSRGRRGSVMDDGRPYDGPSRPIKKRRHLVHTHSAPMQDREVLLAQARLQASSRIAASLQIARRQSLPPSSSSSAVARSRRALYTHHAQDAAQLLAGVESMRVSSSSSPAHAPSPSAPSSLENHGNVPAATTSQQVPVLPAPAPPMPSPALLNTTNTTTTTAATTTTSAPIVQSLATHCELNRHTSHVLSSAIDVLQASQSLPFASNPIAPMPGLDAVVGRRRMRLDAVSATSRMWLAVEAGIVLGQGGGGGAAIRVPM